MDIVTELIKTSTEHYNAGHLEAAVVGFAQTVKFLKETIKVKSQAPPKTPPKN